MACGWSRDPRCPPVHRVPLVRHRDELPGLVLLPSVQLTAPTVAPARVAELAVQQVCLRSCAHTAPAASTSHPARRCASWTELRPREQVWPRLCSVLEASRRLPCGCSSQLEHEGRVGAPAFRPDQRVLPWSVYRGRAKPASNCLLAAYGEHGSTLPVGGGDVP